MSLAKHCDGYPSELVPLLLKLGEKEPKTAKELALEIVNKLRKENFDSNYEAVGLAVFLVGEVISSTRQPKEEEPAEKRAELLDAQTGREFLEFLTDAALKKPSGALFSNLLSMVDDLEQVAPARAALLKQKSSEIEKENTDANPYIRLQQLSQTSDPKALLELAQTAPREVRDSLYSQAASLAWQQGDKAKANEIATTKISSPYERSRLLLSFQEQTIAELIRTEDFVQARQEIAQTRSTERRVQQLTDLAAGVAEKNDKKAAIELLQEAQRLLPAKARNENELESLLRLAGAYSRLDPDRSFALIGSTIDQINELMAATALVANFGPSIVTVKDDEFDIDAYSRVSYGLRILSSRDIRTLAEVNFEKTKGMFDRFQRPEIRIAAYLLMSQSVLEPESEDDCTCQERLRKQKSKSANKESQ